MGCTRQDVIARRDTLILACVMIVILLIFFVVYLCLGSFNPDNLCRKSKCLVVECSSTNIGIVLASEPNVVWYTPIMDGCLRHSVNTTLTCYLYAGSVTLQNNIFSSWLIFLMPFILSVVFVGVFVLDWLHCCPWCHNDLPSDPLSNLYPE